MTDILVSYLQPEKQKRMQNRFPKHVGPIYLRLNRRMPTVKQILIG